MTAVVWRKAMAMTSRRFPPALARRQDPRRLPLPQSQALMRQLAECRNDLGSTVQHPSLFFRGQSVEIDSFRLRLSMLTDDGV